METKIRQVNGFLCIEGVDKSVDRMILLEMLSKSADRLGNILNGGRTVFEAILTSVPNVVLNLARNGYLSPEEVESSPACSNEYKRACQRAEKERQKNLAIQAEARAKVLAAREKAEKLAAEIGQAGEM